MSQKPDNSRIPVTVITGFLGSGKTTLLSKVLPKPEMKNSIVIINEFGEIALDHFLVTKPKEEVILLNGGCLCCTVRGDLVNTLTSLLTQRTNGEIPQFDRVLVETTGLADPIPLLLTVTNDPELSSHYTLDGVITVVDAINAPDQFDQYSESVKQVAVADRVFLSKVDLAMAPDVEKLHQRLHRINPGAQVIEILHGEVEPDLLFGVHPYDDIGNREHIDNWLRFNDHQKSGEHVHGRAGEVHVEDGTAPPHSHHDDAIQTFGLYHDRTISPTGLRLWIDMMGVFNGPNLLRMKGLLNVNGDPVVVQAVQHLFHPPTPLSAWPTDDHRSQFVFITRGISQVDIERTFKAFEFTMGPQQGAQDFDPQRYDQFIKAMHQFRPAGRTGH
jgi:G3E family GTPase